MIRQLHFNNGSKTRQCRIVNIAGIVGRTDQQERIFALGVDPVSFLQDDLCNFFRYFMHIPAARRQKTVGFVNKNHRHRITAGRIKHLLDGFFGFTDIFAHDIAAFDHIKRQPQFTGNSFGKKGFTGTGQAVKQ